METVAPVVYCRINLEARQVGGTSNNGRFCPAAAASNFMIYEGVEFVIRAGLGQHEWTLLICYPDNVDRSPTVSQFSGSMGDATASARRRIDGWMRRQRRKARAPPPNLPNACSPPPPAAEIRLARLFNIEPSAQALLAMYLDTTAGTKDWILHLRLLMSRIAKGLCIEGAQARRNRPLSFPKIPSARIRRMRENQSIIRYDARSPALDSNVRRRLVQVAAPA